MKIITISREFGSGGREIGKALAETLGVAYYDREIIEEVARRSSVHPDYVEHALQRGELVNYSTGLHHTFSFFPMQPSPAAEFLTEQHRVVHELGSRGDCVIVGRSADTLLSEYHPCNFFIYEDMDSKLQRCRERMQPGETMSDKELLAHIRKIDKARATYHDMISDTKWGERESYHLCVNTTGVPVLSLVPLLAKFAEIHFGNLK